MSFFLNLMISFFANSNHEILFPCETLFSVHSPGIKNVVTIP